MKKISYALPVAIVLILGAFIFLSPASSPPEKLAVSGDQFRIAHRCGRAIYPEDTLFACKKVFKEGIADYLEFDFHLTSDNVPVVIHDDSLDRTTNGTGKISERTWDEIKSLDAAYHFTEDGGKTYPYRNKGIHLDNLESFFKELPDAKLMIEVKPNSEHAADILLDLITKYKFDDKVMMGSFHQNIKDYMYEKRPDLAYYGSEKEITKWVILYQIGLSKLYQLPSDAMAVPTKLSVFNLDSKLIKTAQASGLKVYVWTINELEEIQKWKDAGIDGVMTDNPRLFQELK